MKAQFITFILLTIALIGNAQNCFWAKKFGSNYDDVINSVSTDLNGNVYATGYFEGSSITFGTTTLLNANGHSGFFVVKMSAGGTVLWVKSAYGGIRGNGIATDNNGNVYVTGQFTDTVANFGTAIIHGNAVNYGDVYVVKYDTDGNVKWARAAGGNGQDWGSSLTVDDLHNVYVTGSFYSSSIIWAGSTLVNNYTDNTDFFIAKYDSSGNAMWAHCAGGNRYEKGNSITTFNGNIYVTGTFSSDSTRFGNISFINPYPGSYIPIVVNYDISGNVVWAKKFQNGYAGYGITHDLQGNIIMCAGNSNALIVKLNVTGDTLWTRKSITGSFGAIANSVSADNSGNIFVAGYFTDHTIIFGQDTLQNYGNQNPDVFIGKYDNTGNSLWTKKAGGLATDFPTSIAVGNNGNVYFGGKFLSSPAYFGDVILNATSAADMFIADIYHFSSGILSSTNATCNGSENGSAITYANEGNLPYSYVWNTTPAQYTMSVSNLPAGIATVSITDAFGCSQSSSVTITEPPADSARICMVTVDSLSQHNIIFWDKTLFSTVDSFIVYREVLSNIYQPIVRLHYNDPGMFIDTVASLYFPNTGNPNAGTYRYKLQVHDTCGGYSTFSPYHNTIYFLNNNGTFYWTLPYTVENHPNPVTSYILLRDDNSTGNWHSVSSVTGSQQVISDPLYVIYQNTASWRVKTQWGLNCNAGYKNIETYSSSYSNIFSNNLVGINKNLMENYVHIYPNPAGNDILIRSSNSKIESIDVLNIIGESLFFLNNIDQYSIHLEISEFPDGIYFIKIKSQDGIVSKKLIKQ